MLDGYYKFLDTAGYLKHVVVTQNIGLTEENIPVFPVDGMTYVSNYFVCLQNIF